jgi:uncharacterized protein (DUF58 family)
VPTGASSRPRDGTAGAGDGPVLARRGVVPSAVMISLGVSTLLLAQQGRATGSRWLLTLAIGLGLAVVLDGVWAFVGLRRVDVRVAAASDGTVGVRSPVDVVVERPVGRVSLRMASLVEGDLVLVDAPSKVTMQIVPDVRGVFPRAVFELVARGPFGLVAVRRRADVPLPAPVHVAPAPVAVPGLVHPAARVRELTEGPQPVRAPRTGEITRGVRAWEPGDGRRRVHWPATARTGALMARDLDEPIGDEVVVVVDLGPTPWRGAEHAAGMALWVVGDVLARGRRVGLVTREAAGLVHRPVADRAAAGRRLAAAVTGPPTPVPDGVPADAVLAVGPPPPPPPPRAPRTPPPTDPPRTDPPRTDPPRTDPPTSGRPRVPARTEPTPPAPPDTWLS